MSNDAPVHQRSSSEVKPKLISLSGHKPMVEQSNWAQTIRLRSGIRGVLTPGIACDKVNPSTALRNE